MENTLGQDKDLLCPMEKEDDDFIQYRHTRAIREAETSGENKTQLNQILNAEIT